MQTTLSTSLLRLCIALHKYIYTHVYVVMLEEINHSKLFFALKSYACFFDFAFPTNLVHNLQLPFLFR